VPVIVVGLQSVNTNSAVRQPHAREYEYEHEHEHEQEEDDDLFGYQNTGVEDMSGMDAESLEHDATGGRPGTPHGRPWRSRAADALRGLRPGRRTDGSRGSGAEGNGSTTFFIYVIGGAYSYLSSNFTSLMDTFRLLFD